MIRFEALPVTLDAAASEDAPKTITGIAVPWAPTFATVSDGTKVSFSRGAFDVNAKAAKLIENHDMNKMLGVVTELVDSDEGLLFTAKFADTRASQDTIQLIKAGALDAVSVGAEPVKFKYDKNGIMIVSEARLVELSVVAYGAFPDALITEIAASEPDADEPQPDELPQEETMSQETPTVEASAEIVPTAPIHATAKREFKMPSAAEWISAAVKGGSEF